MAQSLSFKDHSGGLKTNVSPFFYERNETPNALNVENTSQLGAISKAKQYAQYGSDAGSTKIRGILPFESAANSKKLFMATNGIIYEDVAGTWTSRKTGLSDSTDFMSAMFYNTLYVTNGSDNMQYTTDGTTWNSVSSATPAFISVFKNRLYGANWGGANRNRFMFSDLGDGTTLYSAGNSVDTIEDAIVGMHATYNYLYFFTYNTFWAWDESYLQKVDNVGTSGGRSIASGNGRLFFANRDGVWMSTGGKAQLISRPVQYWWDGIDEANITELNAAFYKNEYYLWIGDSQGENEVVLVFNSLYNSWRVLTDWPSEEMAVWTNSNNEQHLYFGNNAADSLVFKVQDVYTAATANVTSIYDYSVAMPGGGDKEFTGLSLHCWAKSAGNPVFQLFYALDWEDTFHELGEWVLQGRGFPEHHKFTLPNFLRGRAIQFRIKEASSANAWTWYGMKLYYDGEKGVDD